MVAGFMSNQTDGKKYREIIDEICQENCCDSNPCEGKYCILKEIIFHYHCKVSLLYQLKCIELFKKDLEEELGENIDTNHASNKWVEDGYNVLFRKYFDESISCEEVYEKIMEYAESSDFEE